ncbi:MAG TPA: alpha/beta family hydrolase [Vicinamibacterales bacterium]|nr:alpha/beta family hydrolase [Vicinamibacterales bacterium]
MIPELSVYPSDRPFAGLVLAHGAGAGQRSHFMVLAAEQLARRGVTTATFDFPYVMERRKVPDKAPVLEESWRAAHAAALKHPAFGGLPLFIGGKSMGGRIASHLAALPTEGVRGVVFFGYPLHPPGRPDQRRDAHLPKIQEPMLFIQGTRDPFGTADDMTTMLPTLSAGTVVHPVNDGDHSFKIRVSVAGRSQDAVFAEIFDEAAAFIRRHV